jgi:hypothetical protein
MAATDPIVFISRSRVKPGKAPALREFLTMGSKGLADAKPNTLALLAYMDEAETTLTIVHVFANADGLDDHVGGAGERSSAAGEFIETAAMTVYGSAGDVGMAAIRHGLPETVPVDSGAEYVAGFLRLAAPSPTQSDTSISGG